MKWSRAKRALGILLLAVVGVAVPSVALALTLTSAGAFIFDIDDTGSGALANGTIDAYDSAYAMSVNAIPYSAGGMTPVMSLGGRQLEMAEVTSGTLRVKRLVYVPAAGGDYARYLDVISNPGATATLATIRINGNMGADSSTIITGSSSGDMALTVADQWFSTDDLSDGSGDTSTAHVVHGGSGSLVAPAAISLSGDTFEWRFEVMVPAGGRVALLTYAIQSLTRAGSRAEAERLVALPTDSIEGLEDYYPDIVNFPVGGAPIIRVTAPDEANEGDEITVTAEVTDLEGDTPHWSWDLDGDGTFGELPDATEYVVPAGTTDGPVTLDLAIEATDGTETRTVTRSIRIENLVPVILSEPPLNAGVRREYRYEIEAEDPAGDLDPLEYLLISRPGGMTIEGNVITWTPTASNRGMSFPAAITVNDGDLETGEAIEQRWMIAVAENTDPLGPMPISPIDRAAVMPDSQVTLVVSNGSDPDGDPLTYEFQVSRTSSFTGASLQGSGEVAEGAGGMTTFAVPAPLAGGLWYWRAWVSDGIVTSAPANASLWVGQPASSVDAGGGDAGTAPPDPMDDSGCSVVDDRGGGAALVSIAVALGGWVRWRAQRKRTKR
jgi:hypothetical protein